MMLLVSMSEEPRIRGYPIVLQKQKNEDEGNPHPLDPERSSQLAYHGAHHGIVVYRRS